MARVIAIDYGLKRTGLAVTDPLRIIATALETIETSQLISFLQEYFKKEVVDEIVVGMPKRLNNQDTDMTAPVQRLVTELSTKFPDKPVTLVDERFTSVQAMEAMITGGMKKKDRQVKGNMDKISAVLILQRFMEKK
ncbi:MAG: Holliday junction resolvase RuvX [Cyclobacteriaceae bacterium]|nr:Holliday junction resolvase RuvX [Cyclobacteriaceae bacterium]